MAWLVQIGIVIALYLLTKAIYVLHFHPLSKYPGPSFWILSRIPYLTALNSGRMPFRIRTLHEEYGPIVRVSANELSFNNKDAWKDIYNRKDTLRPPIWGSRPPGVTAHNMISAPAADHARFRKALNPAYAEKSVRAYEGVVRTYFDKLISRFDELVRKEEVQGSSGKSAVVDLVQWANLTFFDIIGELCWSQSYNCLDCGTGHAFMDVLLHFQALIIGATIAYFPWLNALLSSITPKSAFQMLENIFRDGKERLARRWEAEEAEHVDLVAHIKTYNANSEKQEEKLSMPEIEQNVLAIIVGGSETLTTVFSGAFHHLLSPSSLDASHLEKLASEIRSTFTSREDITASKLAKLPYLNAVIDETLRMCPPIPDMLRRQVPPGGVRIAGELVPEGTTVSVSCYAMFRSEEYFSAPDVFEPERFLNASKDHNTSTSKGSPLSHNDFSAFYPFALGPRNCPGQTLARMELRLLLAWVLWEFDVKMPDEREVRKWTDQKVFWTWEKEALEVEIRRVRK